MKEVKIPENFQHIEKVEELIREQTGDPEAGFNPSTFFLGGEGRHLLIIGHYRKKKGKKGQEIFTESRTEITVRAKFCPFSGLPLYKEVEE